MTGSTTATASEVVFAGVDTHQQVHHVAVITADGREVAHEEFSANHHGYQQLLDWVCGHGLIAAIGVESTGSYGAGLTRHLVAGGIEVYEVARPEKITRAQQGKSDTIDAYSAARQVRNGSAKGRAKVTTGIAEALRMLKIPRDGAVKARTAAYSQLRDLITTAPSLIHDDLIARTAKQRVRIAAAYRPDQAKIGACQVATAKLVLRNLAHRIQALNTEIATADKAIAGLVKQATPTLLAMPHVGPQTAAQLIITAGENIERMRSEAAFAKLVGVAPLPASSGKTTTRHRLNRGGDRQANSALYMITIGRMKKHPETLTYVERRRAQGKSNPEIIRCLKRHLARSIYRALRNDLLAP